MRNISRNVAFLNWSSELALLLDDILIYTSTASDVSRDFLKKPISAGDLGKGGGAVIPPMGPGHRAKPWWDQATKLTETPSI